MEPNKVNSQNTLQEQFLADMADWLQLTGDTRKAFTQRFDRGKSDIDNEKLKIDWNNQVENSPQKLQDELNTICQKLKEHDCPFTEKKRGRQPKGRSPWEQAYYWLWQNRFPEWEKKSSSREEQDTKSNQLTVEILVEQVRQKLLPIITNPNSEIGTINMPWVSRPIPVDKIYIRLNILESPNCEYHFSDWKQGYVPEDRKTFDRLGSGQVRQKGLEAISVVKENSKLLILGKAGGGKTTFLKSLALECIRPQTELFSELVPIFIRLLPFTKWTHQSNSWEMVDYLVHVLANRWRGCNPEHARNILEQGRALILLDGLDEVPANDLENLVESIQDFGYLGNRMIVTCRTQNHRLGGFANVEI
jgi:predicted NACHT family NTPase